MTALLRRTASVQLLVQIQGPANQGSFSFSKIWDCYEANLAISTLKHVLYEAGVAVGEIETELMDTTNGEFHYRLFVWVDYDKLGAVTDVLRRIKQAA